ncbi:MAG: tRNA dihydrouridine synthase DusB [bacterium]
MRLGNLNISGKVLSAPLAGVSNRPFRVLVLQLNAALVYTEMVSSEGIVRRQKRTLSMMKIEPDEHPIGIQLFGARPEAMRQAAEICAREFRPDLIDINFGCPVKKVVGRNGGAAALKDLSLTHEIIQATVEGAGQTPVTVKIRTGWDEASPVYLEVGEIAERAGVAAITLHARSRAGGFSGAADWGAIANLKAAVGIPVVGNGDVRSPEDARRMLDQTGCDAIMVGRASMGNPRIFKEIDHYLQTGELLDQPTSIERMQLARTHARLMVEEFGPVRGAIMMRKYLAWYVKGMRDAAQLRTKMVQVSSLEEIDTNLTEYFAVGLDTEDS